MINLGETPWPLRGPSGAAPSGDAAREAGANRKEVAGTPIEARSGDLSSASESEGYDELFPRA